MLIIFRKIKGYKIELETLDLKYFGFRWWHFLFTKNRALKKVNDKFDLIIDLQTKIRNSMILKKFLFVILFKNVKWFIFIKKNKSNSSDHLENLSLFIEEDVLN